MGKCRICGEEAKNLGLGVNVGWGQTLNARLNLDFMLEMIMTMYSEDYLDEMCGVA